MYLNLHLCKFKRQRVILCVWETFICEGIVGASKATSTRVSCAGAISEELPWRPPLLLVREHLQDKTLQCLWFLKNQDELVQPFFGQELGPTNVA